MPDKISVGGLDYSYEKTEVGMYITTLTAGNFDAQVTAAQALQTAIQGISLIDFEGLTIRHVDEDTETDQPASAYAQRENKWLIRYTDDTLNTRHTLEIGGPDLSLTTADGKTLDVSGGAGAAFVTAFEANALSPAGNAVTFVSATHVGRNN
jgi:hypothetical protein